MLQLEVKTRTGDSTPLSPDKLTKLKEGLRGVLLRAEDEDYDEARKVYNGMHDCRPAFIVQAAGVADVIASLNFARENNLEFAVRGGGHSVPGFATCDGGMVLDLRRMKGIRVDPGRRTVRAEGGCTWGDFNHATHAFGLATTGGVVSTTGIAGLTLGGGMGYLSRSCGLSCDNLISADVVTADGRFLNCNEEESTDLFWAIRGGGGNFGVVTSFEYRVHPISEILGGAIFFVLEAEVLRAYDQFIRRAPVEMGALFATTLAAPLPFIPPDWHGKPVAAVIPCWTGEEKQGQRLLQQIRRFGKIVGEFAGPMPYPAINQLFDQLLPAGLQHYWKANFVREIPEPAVQAHVIHGARTPAIESGTFLMPIDGACHRVARDQTAFSYRDAMYSTVIAGTWPRPEDNEKNIRWVREYYEALRPYSDEGGYVNFMSGDDAARVTANYAENYELLVAVKTKYDPDNLFRRNQNIVPRPASVAA
jgi:FAD/FMN-containing dehydrogenase